MIIKFLTNKGLKIVIIGSKDEENICSDIESQFPNVINLCNKTNLLDVGKLSTKTELSIGNDTGPMHIFAAQWCRTLVLYSSASNPTLCAQRGDTVTILRREHLQDLSVTDVAMALSTVNSGASS